MREVSENTRPATKNEASDNFDRVDLFNNFAAVNQSRQLEKVDGLSLIYNTQSLYKEQSTRTTGGAGDGGDKTPLKAESEGERKLSSPVRNLADSKTSLEAVADSHIDDPLERAIFKDRIDAFSKRAATGEISDDEAAHTLAGIEQLLTIQGNTALPPHERSILAQNAMFHAADPTTIDQGRFYTCNVSTLEEKLFTENPAQAVDILNSVAVDGRYTAPDGREVILDAKSLMPLPFQDSAVPFDGERSYATQVLNHVLANDITQRRVPPQFFTQQSQDDDGKPLTWDDSGERLRYFNGQPVPTFGSAKNSPQISVIEVGEAIERNLGERGQMFVNSDFGAMDGGQTRFGSADELASKLQDSLDKKNIPILEVNAFDRIFTEGSEPGFAGHVVSLRGYDPVSRTVNISNQWGKGFDVTVPLTDLYRATMAPGT